MLLMLIIKRKYLTVKQPAYFLLILLFMKIWVILTDANGFDLQTQMGKWNYGELWFKTKTAMNIKKSSKLPHKR